MMTFTGSPVLPSDDLKLDHVLLCDIYRQLGINFGDRIFARIMDADNEDTPLENITWRRLLIDATKVATALRGKLGSGDVTYGLLGDSSYTYFVNVVAGWLNCWTVILLSTRNSVAGNNSLLEAVKAQALITDSKNRNTAEALLQELPVVILDIFDPDQIDTNVELPSGPIDVGTVSTEEFRKIPLYLHSSGTSGHPKAIPQSYEHIVSDTMVVKNNINFVGAPAYAPLPLCHAIGLYCFTRWPMAAGQIPTFVHTKRPLSSTSMLRHLRRLPGAVCAVAPMLLEDCLREPPSECEVLKTTCRIFYGGAPLDQQAGKRLVEMGAPLVCLYGSTETSMIAVSDFPGPPESRVEDLPYMRFPDHQYVLHWVPFDGKLSELILCPGKLGVPAIINHQDPPGYASNDLWEPHPTLKSLYRVCGRKDSVTVLSNGEKTDNRQIELLLMNDPLVTGVVIFGAGRPLNGVLVRPEASARSLSADAFIDAIWPTVEHVNSIVPNHSRIIRQMIVVADAQEKPFIQSDKGSIKTKDTLSLYADEINAVYDALEAETGGEVVKEVNTPDEIVKYIEDLVLQVAKRPLGDDDDFFENGMDSLFAVQLRTEIKPLFVKFAQGEELAHNIAYTHPTISRLCDYIVALSKGESVSLDDSIASANRIRVCIERWSTNLPVYKASTAPAPGRKAFALTGSTGSLGVHILRYLLEREDVETVYCFHRGASDVAIRRHKKLFKDRALPIELLDSGRAVFVQVDLSRPDLGLSEEQYDRLRGKLTHIIHTAWELNFNWGVERFEKVHIAGVRHLVDLSLASTLPAPPRVVFISSISTIYNHNHDNLVPEEPFDDPGVSSSQGYGEAKFVSERLLDIAARTSGVPVTVIRSGQIAGSSIDGYWAPTEYIPTIFRSSKILGKIPNKLPDARWLPADYCGKAVVELSLQNKGTFLYYHLENPTSTPWSTIASMFIEASSTRVEAIDTREWLVAVEKANKEGEQIPAAALLQFYSEYSSSESQVQLGTDKARMASEAIGYGSITPELMKKYTSWI